jgi:type IV pilus assembly protein PilM
MATVPPGVWGIDLGQCALKAIRLELIEGKVTATAFDYIEHPKILSQPDADPDQLTREALEQFLSRNTLKGDTVVISVPGQSGLARFVKLPPVEEKKIADIVRFEAKQQIPFPLEEVVWDYQKIGSGVVTDGFAMETEIGLFAMKRDMVNRYLQHFKEVNVEVHIVQMAPLGLCNFVAYDLLGRDLNSPAPATAPGEKKNCIVALDIGTDSSNLVITDGDKIIWQRPIPLGGNHFTRALTKDLKLTFAKAEHLKRNAVKSPDLKKILAALKPVLNDFVGEVQRSLGYFTNTHRDAQVQYMVGLGNAFRLPGLQKYLQEKLQLEVKKLAKLERLGGEAVTAAPQFNENVLSFAVAYGLSLQGLGMTKLQTNLLPQEIRFERIVRAKKPWAAAAAAALLLAAAGLTFGRNMEYQRVSNPDIATASEGAKTIIGQITSLNQAFDAEVKRIDDSQKSIVRIGAGVQERFNWQLIYQYVNNALPRPNGEKVPRITRDKFEAFDKYVTPQAMQAFFMVGQKRLAKASEKTTDPKKQAKDEEFIRKHLIQVNIEGISFLYSDDLAPYFEALVADSQLLGMSEEERLLVKDPAKLPKKGWVGEIRGFTYHDFPHSFVMTTFVENLAHPAGVGNKTMEELLAPFRSKTKPLDKADSGADKDKKEEEKKTDEKALSFLVVYKTQTKTNPGIGDFELIGGSHLNDLIGGGLAGGPGGPDPGKEGMARMAKGIAGKEGGPGGEAGEGPGTTAPERSSWRPIGEVAGSVLGGGGAGGGSIIRRGMMGSAGPAPPQAGKGPGEGAQPVFVVPGAPVTQPRFEFVILFVWREPILGASDSQPVSAP